MRSIFGAIRRTLGALMGHIGALFLALCRVLAAWKIGGSIAAWD